MQQRVLTLMRFRRVIVSFAVIKTIESANTPKASQMQQKNKS